MDSFYKVRFVISIYHKCFKNYSLNVWSPFIVWNHLCCGISKNRLKAKNMKIWKCSLCNTTPPKHVNHSCIYSHKKKEKVHEELARVALMFKACYWPNRTHMNPSVNSSTCTSAQVCWETLLSSSNNTRDCVFMMFGEHWTTSCHIRNVNDPWRTETPDSAV